MIGWTVFYNPVPLGSAGLLWLLLPLCVSVVTVYKAIRTQHLRRLPLEIAAGLAYLIGGIVLLGAGLWLVQRFFQ